MPVDYETIGKAIGKMQADAMKVLRAENAALKAAMEQLIDDKFEDMRTILMALIPSGHDEQLTNQVKGLEAFAIETRAVVDNIQLPEVINGVDGRDGENGRDGIDRPILEPVDLSVDKSYPKSTIGTHNGGLWISKTVTIGSPETDPFAWVCMVDAPDSIEVSLDTAKTYKMTARMSSGRVMESTFEIPFPVHKGIWEPGQYQCGDMVTKGHSFWQAMEDTTGEPPGNGWKQILTAPRGKQGEPGKDGAIGKQGVPGRNAV